MADLTPEQWQALIVTELGSLQLVATNIATYWALAADAASDGERYLLAKRASLDLILGQAANQVSFRALDGASVNLSDRFEHLVQLRALVQAAIDAGVSVAQGGGALGEMTTTAPIMAPHGARDANAQAYRGSPYDRRWRR
jgi:hypothetical protein